MLCLVVEQIPTPDLVGLLCAKAFDHCRTTTMPSGRCLVDGWCGTWTLSTCGLGQVPADATRMV